MIAWLEGLDMSEIYLYYYAKDGESKYVEYKEKVDAEG